MSNPLRSVLKTADIVAGAIAVLLALPGLDTPSGSVPERIVLIVVMAVSLVTAWFVARNRYWMIKIFLYAGIMLLFTLIARLLFHAAFGG